MLGKEEDKFARSWVVGEDGSCVTLHTALGTKLQLTFEKIKTLKDFNTQQRQWLSLRFRYFSDQCEQSR